jgi:hypothetical protein
MPVEARGGEPLTDQCAAHSHCVTEPRPFAETFDIPGRHHGRFVPRATGVATYVSATECGTFDS